MTARLVAFAVLAGLPAVWGAGDGGGTLPTAPGPAGGDPSRAVRTVVLDVRHSAFSEQALTVRQGETVRFVVRNRDPIPHELIVGDDAVQDVHERGTEAHHAERPGEVSVAAGAVAETTYTFASPGRLWFGCHLPGHWDYGMKGEVRVLPVRSL